MIKMPYIKTISFSEKRSFIVHEEIVKRKVILKYLFFFNYCLFSTAYLMFRFFYFKFGASELF